MKITFSRGLFLTALTVAAVAAIAFAVDPAQTLYNLQHALAAQGHGFSLAEVPATLTAIAKAIEEANGAFEQFKKANDERLAKIEKGEGGQSFDMSIMTKAFEDMATRQKEVKDALETLEAKQNRRNLSGASGGADDEGGANPADVKAHREAFRKYIVKGTDFDLGLEQKALATTTNSGADGGYAVPKVIDTNIESLVVNISPIRGIARVTPVSTSDYHRLVNLRGTASGWVGETAARPSTNSPTLADIKPTMGELYANPQATQVVLDDPMFNVESWLAEEIATEFARAEGAAFVSGSGTNQPTGFLTPTYVSTDDAGRTFGQLQYIPTGVSGGFAAVSSTVNPADVLFTTMGKLKKAYRQGATWVLNKATLFTISAFKDAQGRYVFTPVQSPSVPDMICGYELVEAEDMPAIAANSLSIAFGNFQRGYEIVDRMGTRVIRDPFSNKPYIGFYTTKRVGGIVINSEAIKAVKFSVS